MALEREPRAFDHIVPDATQYYWLCPPWRVWAESNHDHVMTIPNHSRSIQICGTDLPLSVMLLIYSYMLLKLQIDHMAKSHMLHAPLVAVGWLHEHGPTLPAQEKWAELSHALFAYWERIDCAKRGVKRRCAHEWSTTHPDEHDSSSSTTHPHEQDSPLWALLPRCSSPLWRLSHV
jgi:hypothetical protein